MRTKKISTTTKSRNAFQIAVEATPQIENAYNPGLKALKQYSSKIQLTNTNECQGSVEIDESVKLYYPQDNRWDYCFSYKNEVFFVEVHTASTSEVSTVLRKLRWLKDWLHHQAPHINALKAKSKHPFYWIQSSGFHILPSSQQYRQAIQENIKPIGKLSL